MLNVEIMDPGSQLIAKGKIVRGNNSQNPQSKDQVSDFLMNVLTRLIEFSNQGSTEGQGESVELNQPAKDSKASNSVDTGTQEDLTDNIVSVYPSVSLVLGKPDPSGVLTIGSEANQEKKPAQQSDHGSLESISSGKGVVLGGPLNKEEEKNLTQSNPVLPIKDQKLVLSLDQSPVDGTYITTQESEEAKSVPMDPNIQASAAGLILKGTSNKEKGIINETGYTVRVKRGEQPVLSSAQSLVDEIPVQAQESKDTKSGSMNSSTQGFAAGLILEKSSNKEEGIINETGYTVRVKWGEQPVLSSAKFLVEEFPVQAQKPEESKSGSMDPNKKIAVEGVTLKESPENTENLNFTLEGHLPENILKRFAAKVAQTLIDGTSGKTVNPEGKDSKFKKFMEQSSEKVAVKGESLPDEFIKVQGTGDRQSLASIQVDKTEGQPLGKESEKQKGLDQLFKSESPKDQKNLFSTKGQEGLGKALEREVVIDPDLPKSGEVLQGKGNEQAQISQIGLGGGAFGDSISKEKTINDKLNRFDQPQRSFELDFLKDNHFIVKKQSSSSMEIVLEPAGLGKLDIELNLTNDRLYGQIMVNDSAGKGLIEKNLPQLLSELVSEGLQIGGFTVSLKNQGRDQKPVQQSRNEFKEPSLITSVPERIIPVQGNHLIHIII